ncbi:MAG TPA: hypothetical protein DD413_04105 [Ruminococcus sp.]|nr:hypothetical protein [Ruminococcus sp.]
MIVYSGNKLKEHIANLKEEAMVQTGLDKVYERDFVDSIRKYCFGSKIQRVYVVCGLRATGKTFGLFQAVEDFNDTIYIRAQLDESQTGRDYIEYLRNVKEKNIIIDEYTWIKDNRDLSYYLWTLVEDGKRIVITGTHSLDLDYLECGELVHRTNRINVNMFSYEEFCRIYQKPYCKESCIEFLKTGGIFTDYAIDNFRDLTRYIQEAVIDDLARFMNLPIDEAKAIVYDIMYLAVCDSTETNIKYPESRIENQEYRTMLTNFGIDPDVEITPFKFKVASEVLEKARFVIKTYNIVNEEEYRLHLVNPSIAYQMVNAVFDKKSADEKLGKAFESYMVNYMYTRTNTNDYIWYADMGQKTGKPELELIIVNPDDHLVYLFDSKLREAASLPEKSSLVSEDLEAIFTGADVAGRFVVCNTKTEKCGERNGKKVIFTRLDCDTLQNYRQFDENYNRLAESIGNGDDEKTKPTKPKQVGYNDD